MRCPRCGQDADRRGATRMAAPMFAVCNNCDWPLPDKRKGNERKMKTMEERIMEIGAKVMDEMLLHKTDVTVMMKNSGSEFNIYVDVHLVTMFSNYEKEELE
ncbi:hypothetical protein KAT51_06940 [bacterium]|nr:hypothetical protein [bacterium]